MRIPRRTPGATGFTLLPVVLAMSLVAAIAFLLNRDNGVNTNLIGAQSDRARARYAAEAGLQAANYAIQAKVCAGGYPIASSPVTDGNFGGAAYSAYANNTSGSPLTLTSTGIYNGTSVTLTKLSVYAFQAGIKTWSVQPDLFSSSDTWVDPAAPNSSHGGDAEVRLDGGGRELLIQFDLTPLPPGSRISAANMLLFKNNSASGTDPLYVMPITRSWSESFATWNRYDGVNNWPSPGVGYDPRPVSVNPFQTALGYQSLDLTYAAIAWRTGLYPNNGVWVRAGPNIGNAKFALSSDLTAANRPKLVVSYLLPCGATAP